MFAPNSTGRAPIMSPSDAQKMTSYLFGLGTPQAVQAAAAKNQHDISFVALASSVAAAMKNVMAPQSAPPQGTVAQQAVQQMAPQQMAPQQMASQAPPQQMPQQLPETSGIGQLNPGQGVQNMAGGGITGEPHVKHFAEGKSVWDELKDQFLFRSPSTPSGSATPSTYTPVLPTQQQAAQGMNADPMGLYSGYLAAKDATGNYLNRMFVTDPNLPQNLAEAQRKANIPAVIPNTFVNTVPAAAEVFDAGGAKRGNAEQGGAAFNSPTPLFGGARKAVVPGLPTLQGQGGGYQPLTESDIVTSLRNSTLGTQTPTDFYVQANGLTAEKDAATKAQYQDIKDMSKKDRANLDERSDNALAMALMKAGFTMMGTPGGLSTAVGKGGIEGLQSYTQDKSYVDQARRELNKADLLTQTAQDAELRGNRVEAQTYINMANIEKQNAMLSRMTGIGLINESQYKKAHLGVMADANAIQRAELPAKLELLGQQARQAGANADYLGVTKIDAQQRAQIENLVSQDMKKWYENPANFGKAGTPEAETAANNFRMQRAAALGVTPGTAAPSIDPTKGFTFNPTK